MPRDVSEIRSMHVVLLAAPAILPEQPASRCVIFWRSAIHDADQRLPGRMSFGSATSILNAHGRPLGGAPPPPRYGRLSALVEKRDPVRSGVPLPRHFGCIRQMPTNRANRPVQHNPVRRLPKQQHLVAECAAGVGCGVDIGHDAADSRHLVCDRCQRLVAFDAAPTNA